MKLPFATMLLAIALMASTRPSFGQYNFTTLDDPLGTNGTYAYGISGNDVVGFYQPSGGPLSGFLYDGSTYTTLSDPLGTTTAALGISGNTVVGFYSVNQGLVLGYGFTYNTSTQTYTTLDHGNSITEAIGISSNGTIVGQSDNDGFSYTNGVYTIFDVPQALAGTATTPTGIYGNIIAGSYTGAGGVNYGFIYNGTNYVTVDDPLATHVRNPLDNSQPGALGTFVNGIYGNVVVGYYYDSNYLGHGFLYDGTTYTTIDDPLGVKGTAINGIDGNNLVGSYVDGNGVEHGFEAALAPEPSTLDLLGAGLLIFAWATHRRAGSRGRRLPGR